jgi:hypothetical protein
VPHVRQLHRLTWEYILKNEIVILSAAKDLLLFHRVTTVILRDAQNLRICTSCPHKFPTVLLKGTASAVP